MTRTIWFYLVLTLCAVPAFSQGDVIGLYSDPAYTDCNVVDGSPGMISVYVVHESSTNVTASQFMVTTGSGVSMVYVSESSPHVVSIGDTQSGISITYGGCATPTVLITTITYFGSGASSSCSSIRVVPDINSPTGTIEVVDCSYLKSEGIGGRLVINPDGSCECGPDTKLTSWGRIKSVFD